MVIVTKNITVLLTMDNYEQLQENSHKVDKSNALYQNYIEQ